MAGPIIFTLLLGDKDQILAKVTDHKAEDQLTVISLQTNKETEIPDKDRIFAEILEESEKQNKNPIFNVQLNNSNVKPIYELQDVINLQNLNIKNTITFDHYNSIAENPKLTTYWKKLLTKIDHVFFANEQDRELAIKEGIVSKEKTSIIKDVGIDSVISVFNNLALDQKANTLISSTIPSKKKLTTLIEKTKNQNGRIIVKTWPLSLDEATDLITAKFGITSEDQIYGLKLEITEILKDKNNAAQNLQKYVSQISQQFQKDLGKTEVNPIDFNFDKEKVMKNKDDNKPISQVTAQTRSNEPPKKNQPTQPGFFRRVFNYFKKKINAIFGGKEEIQATQTPHETEPNTTSPPTETIQQQAAPALPKAQPSNKEQDKPWLQTGMTERDYKAILIDNAPARQTTLNINEDIANIKKPDYLYTEDDIKKILEANIDQSKFSIVNHASLKEPELLKDTLKVAINDLVVENKSTIIPLNTGHEHWLILMAQQDSKGNINFIYNDPTGRPMEERPEIKKYIEEVYPGAEIQDLKTLQQWNNSDCGVFVCDNAIKLANGQPILKTTKEENKGQELRNQHAEILTKVMANEQAQKIGQQAQNRQSNEFQNLVTNQRTTNSSRGR